MKRIVRQVSLTLLSVVIGGVLPLAALGQSAPGEGTVADPSRKATIRAVEAKMQEGVLQRDLETLRRLWVEDFMVNAPRNVVVPNREAVFSVFRKGIVNYSTFDPQIDTIRIYGKTAVVMGSETVKPVGEAPYAGKTVHRRYTHVWKQQAERWRLVARHAHIVSVE